MIRKQAVPVIGGDDDRRIQMGGEELEVLPYEITGPISAQVRSLYVIAASPI